MDNPSWIRPIVIPIFIILTQKSIFKLLNIYWDGLSHIDKLKVVCTLYKLLEPFFPLPYGFGMVYTTWLVKCVHLVFSPIIAGIYNKFSLI